MFFIFCYHVGQSHKKGLSPAERVQQLAKMSNKNPILRLDVNEFRDYVETFPRNYSFIVMFTAMGPHWMCSACRYASDELKIVAVKFRQSQEFPNKLFFAVVDYDDASVVFQKMGLDTAPNFIHFSPRGIFEVADTMNILSNGFSAKAIAKWIVQRTGIAIPVSHSLKYSRFYGPTIYFALTAWVLYWQFRNFGFFYVQAICVAGTIFLNLAMMFAQVWTRIRESRFVDKDGNGQSLYNDDSFLIQFLMETYTVIAFYVAAVCGLVILTEAVRRLKEASIKTKILTIFGLVLFVRFFSLVLSVSSVKIPRYPYIFLFK